MGGHPGFLALDFHRQNNLNPSGRVSPGERLGSYLPQMATEFPDSDLPPFGKSVMPT